MDTFQRPTQKIETLPSQLRSSHNSHTVLLITQKVKKVTDIMYSVMIFRIRFMTTYLLFVIFTWRFGQQIRNTCKVLKCGAGEGWRRSVGPITRNEDVLLRVNKQRNILHKISKQKANWIGHILRRNCLLKQVIEGKTKGEIEVTRWQRRRRKKLLDNLMDRRG
jgi:hypothetical protein